MSKRASPADEDEQKAKRLRDADGRATFDQITEELVDLVRTSNHKITRVEDARFAASVVNAGNLASFINHTVIPTMQLRYNERVGRGETSLSVLFCNHEQRFGSITWEQAMQAALACLRVIFVGFDIEVRTNDNVIMKWE